MQLTSSTLTWEQFRDAGLCLPPERKARVRLEARVGTCLQGSQEGTQGIPAAQVQAGLVAVVKHLLGLLTLFIGSQLTTHSIREVWPGAPCTSGGAASTLGETLP